MQTLGLNNSTANHQSRFWARFHTLPTHGQKTFDWIFGVFLPIICFVFDPIVFKGNAWGVAILGEYKPFAYLLCLVSVTAMAAWLLCGTRLRWLNGFFAGLFLCGGLISLIVGVVLIPISLAGLIILVGALGFTPLFTAFVYLRNAARAYYAAKAFLIKSVRIYALAFGCLFSVSLAWTINSQIRNSLEKMVKGDARSVYAEAPKFKYLTMLVNFDKLALAYYRPAESELGHQEKMRALADVFKQLTGEDIESKSRVLMD